MYLADHSTRVRHETIYTSLYPMQRGELRTELLATLGRLAKLVFHMRVVKTAVAKFIIWSAFTNDRQKWMTRLLLVTRMAT